MLASQNFMPCTGRPADPLMRGARSVAPASTYRSLVPVCPRTTTFKRQLRTLATSESSGSSPSSQPVPPIRDEAAASNGTNGAGQPAAGVVAEQPGTSADSSTKVLEDTRAFLYDELSTLFTTGRATPGRYADRMEFEDPLVRLAGLTGYQLNLTMLRTLFDIDFKVYSVKVSGQDELLARWSMRTFFRLAPWRPEVTFTGRSIYRVDLSSGQILSQRDEWDAVDQQRFPSPEAYAYVIQALSTVRLTPDLETPQYEVLRRAREYEVRQYQPFVVAETAMPTDNSPASGEGFNRVAGYIFGGNAAQERMEMTTPVFTTSSGPGQPSRMQFVLEKRLGDTPDAMPLANDAAVSCTRNEGGVVAASTFSGWALDWEVAAAERGLRGALLLDGLQPEEGYELARYNDPFTPPFLRRNEVLIRLRGFDMDRD